MNGQVVLQVGADLLVGAFGVAGDPLEVLFELGVVVDLEVVGRVDVPVELVVVDVVLAEVRDERRLRGGRARVAGDDQGNQQRRRADGAKAGNGTRDAHKQYLRAEPTQ